MTGVELGCGTGAGFTISGSTPGAGLSTPPLASNLSLRFFSWLRFRLACPRGATHLAATNSSAISVANLQQSTLKILASFHEHRAATRPDQSKPRHSEADPHPRAWRRPLAPRFRHWLFLLGLFKIDQSFVRQNGKGARPIILRSIVTLESDAPLSARLRLRAKQCFRPPYQRDRCAQVCRRCNRRHLGSRPK